MISTRLVSGRANSSFGTYCARLAGLPDELVTRGVRVSTALAKFDPIPMQVTEKEKQRDSAAESLAIKMLDMDLENVGLATCWTEVERFERRR
ncbi:hypothetical protein M427DRAFT_51640 [Gonapodya prolifera JEL478]|uniref:DNA mismatch repair proteins mutS family domain-containing protein n=1 Tax=Gonapodya prolifera (strain JEL478) TaxID=1344416 RepID=A0A139AXI1_GONPJ|nr:hypothetical protein M427DRAFT_51640 [Gonapodya prolifera JEL478]|eukprot:KXS21419.1 hypothetical protein M427DRAFT_51640 [Gonapodya prolifera JEL478]